MTNKIRLIQVGLGPVGQILTPFLLDRPALQVVGAVDLDPKLVGKDLGEVSKVGKRIGIPIRESLTQFKKNEADLVVLTTASKFSDVVPTLEAAAQLGLRVVSTCEEMVYPWKRWPDLASKVDALAKSFGVAFLSTGVNPGFLMDLLPIVSTAICRDVRSVRIERFQDASKRRIPFQKKIGTGLTVEEFQNRVASGKLGHVGLTESMHMMSARFGWPLDKTEDIIEPVVADRDTESGLGLVSKGKVIGLSQTGRGWRNGKSILNLEFRASIGEAESRDSIHVDGTPTFRIDIPGGIHGDIATCAITTNAIYTVMEASPGLRTMIDIPPVAYRGN